MPIWSLTLERVNKLLGQIGEKEAEVDTLIKLSVKDLWIRDLDDFIKEWRFQLEDDKQAQLRQQRMGRRGSSKLKIGATKEQVSKKRKAEAAENGDDLDDSDFDGGAAKVTKAKKTAPVMRKIPTNQTTASAFFKAIAPPAVNGTTTTTSAASTAMVARPRAQRKAATTAAAAVAAAVDSSEMESD